MKENTKTVFNYLKEHDGEDVIASDIAEATGLPVKSVNGIITSALVGTGKNKANKSYVERIPGEIEETDENGHWKAWSDGDIGYPKTDDPSSSDRFAGNYTAADGGNKVAQEPVYRQEWNGRRWQNVLDHYEYKSATGRRYYDSVVAPNEIASRAKTAITQIDAVLYNNHGIFGKLGQCTINGSLVCRNEGMIFSGKLYLNWDYRLYSGSPENVMNQLVGMPLGTGRPIVQFWQEVPDVWSAD